MRAESRCTRPRPATRDPRPALSRDRASSQRGEHGGGTVNLEELSFLIIVVVLMAFYVVLIRPSQQEQKRQQKAIRDLRDGR